MTDETLPLVIKSMQPRIEVEIPDPDDDAAVGERWVDRIWATWRPRVGPPVAIGGWWEIGGENTGTGNGLVLHDYQIEPLILLLRLMQEHNREVSDDES